MKEQLGGSLGTGMGSRDRLLLDVVADLRLVTGNQLARLAFGGPTATSTHPRLARRTMQRLTDQGLLLRLQRRVGGIYGGSSSHIYAISPKGRAAIGRPLSRGRVREPSLAFLGHHLGIAEVYTRLQEALLRGELEDLHLETEPACWRPLVDGSGGVLKPDLYVVASTADSDLLAFVEVDYATEHAAAMRRKLDLYRAHYDTGVEQQAEGVFPEVLWVPPDAERAAWLERLAASHPGARLHRVLLPEQFITYVTKGGT